MCIIKVLGVKHNRVNYSNQVFNTTYVKVCCKINNNSHVVKYVNKMLYHVKIQFTYRDNFWYYGIHLYNNKKQVKDFWTELYSKNKAHEKAKEHEIELPENPENNFTIEKIIL